MCRTGGREEITHPFSPSMTAVEQLSRSYSCLGLWLSCSVQYFFVEFPGNIPACQMEGREVMLCVNCPHGRLRAPLPPKLRISYVMTGGLKVRVTALSAAQGKSNCAEDMNLPISGQHLI